MALKRSERLTQAAKRGAAGLTPTPRPATKAMLEHSLFPHFQNFVLNNFSGASPDVLDPKWWECFLAGASAHKDHMLNASPPKQEKATKEKLAVKEAPAHEDK